MPADLSTLRARFGGAILTPHDPGYERARVMFNTGIRNRPAILCQCTGTEDVVTAVAFAREAGLPVSVRGGGHHACGFSLVDRGLVIDLASMKRVTFDPATATANVEAGCGWRDVDRVTYVDVTAEGEAGLPHGYAVPGGECPTVSNAGYSLGGGYGFLGRRYGLACDHIVEAEVVDAGARVLRVAEDEHPDLLWALRGAGGGGFGVVTRLKYRLDPVPKTVVGGLIGWPIEQAEDVLRAYRDLYLDRDDDRLGLFLVLTTDPYPDGEKVVLLYGLYAGPPSDAERHLAPIRSVGRPLFDAFAPTSYDDLQRSLGEEIVYGLQSKWRGGYFRDGGFDDEAFAHIVDRFRRIPSGYSMARFDLLGGGAIAHVPADATAFVHRSSLFYISIISLWERDDETDANVAWADDLAASLRPYLNGEVYQNYADEDLRDWPSAYYGANYARLQQVKKRYDQTDFFRHPQSIRLP
ncbi:MAG TPA: FAD-binding oxidoreductase [Micromonosporaceae bacterium]